MLKKILITSISIIIILIICITYLSFFGIKTDNFNNFINNKDFAINVNTKNAKLIAENNPINISKIDINLNLLKFLKNKSSIKNIKIKSSDNKIKDVTSFVNTLDYNRNRYIFYSQIKKGSLNFEIDVKFDNTSE